MADDRGSAEAEDEIKLASPEEGGKKKVAGAPAWMATFADLVTLLMCFFVLLFAMSTTQQETYKELVKSLRSALGAQAVPESGTREGLTMHAVPSEEPSENQAIDELGGMIEKEMEEIVSEVRELVLFNKLGGEVSVTKTEDGVVITLSDLLLFRKGGTTLSPKGEDILKKVAFVLRKMAYHVKIKGHTDNSPISSSMYPSNWELSSARASTVVRLLIANGVPPQYISAEGYAQYHPVATNDTERGRSYNRRVEIVYERDSIARQFIEMGIGK
ncbi:MAG: flagellar motor protein MotB [Proteobacteria bacterium]|nr:flagellar motor protein MotB [Pseudomonadota bacterium]MBU1389409.1 flagellar motor protein MotB [Pseudomonadota bacterium]MBU1541229.1 flagellar motor protein MotB [Pseudomonadota bacterium]MBU2481041.1 flagellar motor protein MotB [Pseudomonadota bacterium]